MTSGEFPGSSCYAVQPFRVGFPGVTVVADLVVQHVALNHRLKEEVEYVAVELEVLQIPQEVHPLVGLHVARVHVGCPLQLIVDHCTKILVLPDNAGFLSFDHKWNYAALVPSEVDDDLFCFCYIKFQEVLATSVYQLVYCGSV